MLAVAIEACEGSGCFPADAAGSEPEELAETPTTTVAPERQPVPQTPTEPEELAPTTAATTAGVSERISTTL